MRNRIFGPSIRFFMIFSLFSAPFNGDIQRAEDEHSNALIPPFLKRRLARRGFGGAIERMLQKEPTAVPTHG